MKEYAQNSLLAYEIRAITDTSFELELVHIASKLASFLELNPVFSSTEGVTITYFGSHLVLEPRDPPSGRANGIILPRYKGLNSSLWSERSYPSVGQTPRHGTEPLSERARGEGSMQSYMRFRCQLDKEVYIKSIIESMSDLVQAYLDVTNKGDKALMLIILNNRK